MDFLKAIASTVTGAGAYDEPVDAFKMYAPPSLWDAYTPDQQAAYGRQIQSQQRYLNADLRPKYQDVQKGVTDDYVNRVTMDSTEALKKALGDATGLGQGVPPVSGAPAAQAPDQSVIRAQAYRQLANVFAGKGLGDKAKLYLEIADKLDPRETYGGVETVINPETGKPVLTQRSDRGGLKLINGFSPVPDALPPSIREAMVYLGIPLDTDPRSFTPEQRIALERVSASQRAAGSTKVAVNTSDPSAVALAGVKLMTDYSSQVHQAGDLEVPQRYRALQAAMGEATAGNPSADGAIIYNVAKIYDPTGAVQEGDKKTIVGARNLPETVRGMFERWSNGGSLTENERKQLYAVASATVKSRSELSAQRARTFAGYSRDLGGNGSNIVDPYAGIQFGGGTAPKPIAVPGGAPPQQPSKPLGAHFGGR